MGLLQSALLDRDPPCLVALLHVLIELIKFAILDPGIPSSRLVTQLIGRRFSDLEVNESSVTGLLRVFLIGRNGYEDSMSDWLAPPCHFNDLPGEKQAALLAFVCDELVGSSRLISSEIDRVIELQNTLRREKWTLESKIRRLRFIMVRKFNTPITTQTLSLKLSNDASILPSGDPSASNTDLYDCNRHSPLPNSETSAHAFEDSCGLDDPSRRESDFDVGRSGPSISAVALASAFSDIDEETELQDVSEFEDRLATLCHVAEYKQRAIEECSYRLSGLYLGQDRYRRSYYVLGHLGGLYVYGQSMYDTEKASDVGDLWQAHYGLNPDTIVSEIRYRRQLSDERKYDVNLVALRNSRPFDQPKSIKNEQTSTGCAEEQINSRTPSIDRAADSEDERPESDNFTPTERARPASMPALDDGDRESKWRPNSRDVKSMVQSPRVITPAEPVSSPLDQSSQSTSGGALVRLMSEMDGQDLIGTSVPSSTVKPEVSKQDPKWNDQPTEDVSVKCEDQPVRSPNYHTQQPLDLSTKASSSSTNPLHPQAGSRQQSDEVVLLQRLNVDDSSLTTAVILFMTHAGLMPNYLSFGDTLADPWKTIISYYKSLLVSAILEELSPTEQEESEHSLRWAVLSLKESINSATGDTPSNELEPMNVDHVEVERAVNKELGLRSIQRPSTPDERNSRDKHLSTGWWRFSTSDGVNTFVTTLAQRGLREKMLAKAIKRSDELVEQSLKTAAHIDCEFDYAKHAETTGWYPKLLQVSSRRGKGRGGSSTNNNINSMNGNSACSLLDSTVESDGSKAGSEAPGDTTGRERIISSSNCVLIENRLRRRLSGRESDSVISDSGNEKLSTDRSVDKAMLVNGQSKLDLLFANGGAATNDPTFKEECYLLEEVEQLQDRVLSASLQIKGWQAPVKAFDDETIQLIPRTIAKRSRCEYWPLELARARLLGVERHLERRYLLPPLNSEVYLDVVHDKDNPRPASPINQVAELCDQRSTESPDDPGSANSLQIRRVLGRSNAAAVIAASNSPNSVVPAPTDGPAAGEPSRVLGSLPPGLVCWRHKVQRTADVGSVRDCMNELVGAIAWDKSIMKVLCQICRRDNNEAQLLLCDGCDHGYHTYCFRPPIVLIPQGDWFCYTCISRATGKPHCYVCGSVTAQTNPDQHDSILVVCDSCSRVVHATCAKPAMTRVPRKWHCANCTNGARQKASKAVNCDPEANGAGPSTSPDRTSTKKKRPRPSADDESCGGSSSQDSSNRRPIADQSNGCPPMRKRKGRPPGHGNHSGSKYFCTTKNQSPRNTLDKSGRSTKRGRPPGGGSLFRLSKKQQLDRVAGSETDNRHNHSIYTFVDESEARNHSDDELTSSVSTGTTEEQSSRVLLGSGSQMRPEDWAWCRVMDGSYTRHGIGACRMATEDLLKHHASWAFRKPVNSKQVPFYRKIIKHPMDLSTIRKKTLNPSSYSTLDEWAQDVRLIFDNCEIFNEDDSDVGRAGHEMRAYFESRWSEMPCQRASPAPPTTKSGSCMDKIEQESADWMADKRPRIMPNLEPSVSQDESKPEMTPSYELDEGTSPSPESCINSANPGLNSPTFIP